MKPSSLSARGEGIVLLSALLFMAMCAAIAASALQVATLEVRMAENSVIRLLASELADSIIYQVLEKPDAFPVSSTPGQLPCPGSSLGGVCDIETADGAWESRYSISRLAPSLSPGFFLRDPEARATGAGHFDTAMFELAVRVDGPEKRAGAYQAVQGVAVRVPVFD